MVQIPLTTGAYTARSVIANVQRCVNLYPETNPQETTPPAPTTHYPTPGGRLFAGPTPHGTGRALYRASDDTVWAVVGPGLFQVFPNGTMNEIGSLTANYAPYITTGTWPTNSIVLTVDVDQTQIGIQQIAVGMAVLSATGDIPVNTTVTEVNGSAITISQPTTAATTGASDISFVLLGHPGTYADSTTTPASMVDNGIQLVVVNGSPSGWYVTLEKTRFNTLYDPSFQGADKVDYVDTFFLFNTPGTPNWYSSLSLSVLFDPLYTADKEGFSDLLATLIVCRRWIWLLGQRTSEVWYNAGTADFPFAIMPGEFVEHGCTAIYTVQKYDDSVYWLTTDKDGHCIIVKGLWGNVQRISTWAIEAEISKYPDIDQAVGMTYQQNGHAFYVLTFRQADKTWVFDISTQQWHEWVVIDQDGNEHCHPAVAMTYAWGKNLCLEYSTGRVFWLDPDYFQDDFNFGLNGPTVRRRSFPHVTQDGKRRTVWQFVADVSVGNQIDTVQPPLLNFRYSITRGASWSTTMVAGLGNTGQYDHSMQFQRLGSARDWVFEVFWSGADFTTLNGAWIESQQGES